MPDNEITDALAGAATVNEALSLLASLEADSGASDSFDPTAADEFGPEQEAALR